MNASTQADTSACASGERPVLAIRGLVHRWPRVPSPAFEVPSLTLHAGESLFIHGPSGCGKSTLLSLICGIAVAAEGELRVQGQDWRGLGAGRRDAWRADHIGCVFQQFNLLPFLNALDNAMLPARFSRKRRLASEARGGVQAEATRLLRHMGLDDDAMRRPSHRLSVGQQQRVAVARALLGSPALVVADEPTSALDEGSCVAFLQTLKAACADARSALVFVSHDRRLTSACDRSLAWHALTGGSP